MTPLMRKYNYINYINTHDKENLRNLIQKPLKNANNNLYIINKQLIELFTSNAFLFNEIKEDLLFIINDANYKKGESINLIPFKDLQEKTSKSRYYKGLADLFIYIYNYINLNINHAEFQPRILDQTHEIIKEINIKINLFKSEDDDDSEISQEIKKELFNLYIKFYAILIQQNTAQKSLDIDFKFESPIITFYIIHNYDFNKEVFKSVDSFSQFNSILIYMIKYIR